MVFSVRELWTILHGMVLGVPLLVASLGLIIHLSGLRRRWMTAEGIRQGTRWLKTASLVLAVSAWLTVISGTYVIFPWYRAQPTAGASLRNYPQALLLSRPETRAWHSLAAEWKEHAGWFVPILSTAIAYVIAYYGAQLAEEVRIRRTIFLLALLILVTAALAGLIGAFLNKVAPVR